LEISNKCRQFFPTPRGSILHPPRASQIIKFSRYARFCYFAYSFPINSQSTPQADCMLKENEHQNPQILQIDCKVARKLCRPNLRTAASICASCLVRSAVRTAQLPNSLQSASYWQHILWWRPFYSNPKRQIRSKYSINIHIYIHIYIYIHTLSLYIYTYMILYIAESPNIESILCRSGHEIQTSIFGLYLDIKFKIG